MKILMVASEAEPYSKTGGLADVIGALPRALVRLGHEVSVVTPLYRSVIIDNPHIDFPSLTIGFGAEMHFPRVVSAADRGVRIYFVDYPKFFDRDGYYGDAEGDYPDNPERFTLLCRVAIEIAKLAAQPDLFHCHDWQAAMLPVLLKSVFATDNGSATPVLLTIHNLGYHGYFTPDVIDRLGLPPTLFTIAGLEYYGHVNFLKGGLLFADHLSTVSEGYAREIQTPEYGHSLDGILRQRGDVLHGIVNGVDYSQWNPETDPHILERYSANSLDGKRACKKALLEAMGLPPDAIDRPLIGMVTRLAAQKGADLLIEAGGRLMERNATLAVLGSGEKAIVDFLVGLKVKYPERVGLKIGYDEALAHQVEAGADMFLMPSRYEPCGLNQMYSLKYGTPPIVRATGGLDDTVDPFDPAAGSGTGFKFSEYTAAAMLASIDEALGVYSDRDLWLKLVRNGMAKDFSWDASATKYEALYKAVAASAG
jgi:starch synthase